ncbi:hypothetical protein FOL47_010294 [Perkinsus chesapeaki]|uniref:Integrase catalytic domain-containing protein n=1 Tax=Perkinsus chesapeaki TaxID=330153 RepID=A0A7J6L458_PERCH|nr:hypothetical protein FOL47_010294 [Perkinsus chesapeaki]
MELRSGSKLPITPKTNSRTGSRLSRVAFSLSPSSRIPSHSTGIDDPLRVPLQVYSGQTDDNKANSDTLDGTQSIACEPPHLGTQDGQPEHPPGVHPRDSSKEKDPTSSQGPKRLVKGPCTIVKSRLKTPVARLRGACLPDRRGSARGAPNSSSRSAHMQSTQPTSNGELSLGTVPQGPHLAASVPAASPCFGNTASTSPTTQPLASTSTTTPAQEQQCHRNATTSPCSNEHRGVVSQGGYLEQDDVYKSTAEHVETISSRPVQAAAERSMYKNIVPCSNVVIACQPEFPPCQYGYSISHLYNKSEIKADEGKPRQDLERVPLYPCGPLARPGCSEPFKHEPGHCEDPLGRSDPSIMAGHDSSTGISFGGIGGSNGGGLGGSMTGGTNVGPIQDNLGMFQPGRPWGDPAYDYSYGINLPIWGSNEIYPSSTSEVVRNLGRAPAATYQSPPCAQPCPVTIESNSQRLPREGNAVFGGTSTSHAGSQHLAGPPHHGRLYASINPAFPNNMAMGNTQANDTAKPTGSNNRAQYYHIDTCRLQPHQAQQCYHQDDGNSAVYHPRERAHYPSSDDGQETNRSSPSSRYHADRRHRRAPHYSSTSNRRRSSSSSRRSSSTEGSFNSRGRYREPTRGSTTRLHSRHRVYDTEEFYVPAKRSIAGYHSKCPGCHRKPCAARIPDKDFDSASNNATRRPSKSIFAGDDDDRNYREANLFSLRGGYPQNHLHGTLLLLRSSKYFVAGDLSKAFCRMQSNRSDIPYVGYTCLGPFTVLWVRVGFGTKAAPNMLDSTVDDVTDEIYGLTQLVSTAEEDVNYLDMAELDSTHVKDCLLLPSDEAYDYLREGPSVPRRVKLLKFVDDIYALGSSVEEAQRNYSFASHVLKGHDLPAEDLKKFENWLSQVAEGVEKRGHLLGYDYLPSSDGLYPTMSAERPQGDLSMTKRSASSVLASLYDPLGILIEHDILARSIWRNICLEAKDWEQTVSRPLQQQVTKWAIESIHICQAVSTRRYLPYDSELILSTDASKDAWGADLRLKSRPDTRLSAKGALYSSANLPWSIPRKELDALHRGLVWVKALSPFLPVPTIYGKNQAPLNKLCPDIPTYPLVVAIDSELTVYRLKRPSNDERLQSPEKRRLQAIRDLCVQLHATVRHIPSGCNPADSISRYSMGKAFNGAKLVEAIDSDTVIYDPFEPLETSQDLDVEETLCCSIASSIDDAGWALTTPLTNAGCCSLSAPTYDNDICTIANAGCGASLAPDSTIISSTICGSGNLTCMTTSTPSTSSTVVDAGRGQGEQPELGKGYPHKNSQATTHGTSYPSLSEKSTPYPCQGRCHLINCDGLDVPDIDKTDLVAELKVELKSLARHIDTSRGIEADLTQLADNIDFNADLVVCLKRCQSEDEDLLKFRDYLLGRVPKSSVGLRSTVFDRFEGHCYLDPNGIIRQRPWYEGPAREDDVDGTIYLGTSRYAKLVASILCAIYHYVLSHPGQRKLRLFLQRRYSGRGLTKIIAKTTSSCTLCLKARASKAIRYANNAVQDMVVTQLWQLIGIDILGPYGRASTRDRGGANRGEHVYQLDPAKDYYALVCQDGVSGFIASRPLRDCKGSTIAAALHSVFCEHGPPSVALCDKAHGSLLSKSVLSIMAKHRCRLYCLPGYSPHESFWERSHRDLAETVRTISGSADDPADHLFNLMLAIRIYNCSPKHWTYMSPSYLHYSYGGRLPGDAPPSTIRFDKLDSRYINAEYLPFARGLLPVLADYQERMRSSVEEYVEAWRQKQADLRERYIKETPQCDCLRAFDLVYLLNAPDVDIGNHLSTKWRGPYTVVSMAGSSMARLVYGVVLPTDYGGILEVSDDKKSISNWPLPDKLLQAATRNLIPAKSLQSLIYDHYRRGIRVYQDIHGDFATMDASMDGSDQSKIQLERARQLCSQRSVGTSIDGPMLRPSSLTAEEDLGCPSSSSSSSTVPPVPEVQRCSTSTGSQSRSTTATFGSRLCVYPQDGWLVASTSRVYSGLGVVSARSSTSNATVYCGPETKLVNINPVDLGRLGDLSISPDVESVIVEQRELIYIAPSTRSLTRSLLTRTSNLLERLHQL